MHCNIIKPQKNEIQWFPICGMPQDDYCHQDTVFETAWKSRYRKLAVRNMHRRASNGEIMVRERNRIPWILVKTGLPMR